MALSLLSLSVSDCSSLLPASRIAEIDHAIATHPVTLLGMAHMRCTDAALQRLEGVSAAYGCCHVPGHSVTVAERRLPVRASSARWKMDASVRHVRPRPPKKRSDAPKMTAEQHSRRIAVVWMGSVTPPYGLAFQEAFKQSVICRAERRSP